MIRYLLLFLMIPNICHAFECTEQIDNLSNSIKVPIYCNVESYQLDEEEITGDQPNTKLLDNFYPSLNKFVKDNGSKFIHANVQRIILMENLKLNNIGVSGLSNGKQIIVNMISYKSPEEEAKNYTSTLNHEMSSCVLKNTSMYQRIIWKQLGLIYNVSKQFFLQCLRDNGFAIKVNDYLLENGFLSNYSLTSSTNDFNTYAEKLFVGDTILLKNKVRHKKVKEKLELFKQIYREAGFTGKFPDEI